MSEPIYRGSGRNVSAPRQFDAGLRESAPSLKFLATQYQFFSCSLISRFGGLDTDLVQEYVEQCAHEPKVAVLRFPRRLWYDFGDDDNLLLASELSEWTALSAHIASASMLDRDRPCFRIVLPHMIYIKDAMLIDSSKRRIDPKAEIPVNVFSVLGTDCTYSMVLDDGLRPRVRKTETQWEILRDYWSVVAAQLGDQSRSDAWQRTWPLSKRAPM